MVFISNAFIKKVIGTLSPVGITDKIFASLRKSDSLVNAGSLARFDLGSGVGCGNSGDVAFPKVTSGGISMLLASSIMNAGGSVLSSRDASMARFKLVMMSSCEREVAAPSIAAKFPMFLSIVRAFFGVKMNPRSRNGQQDARIRRIFNPRLSILPGHPVITRFSFVVETYKHPFSLEMKSYPDYMFYSGNTGH